MNETKLGPNGETIDQDGEVIAPRRPRSGWRRWWAATDGIRLMMLCWLVMLAGLVAMTKIHAS